MSTLWFFLYIYKDYKKFNLKQYERNENVYKIQEHIRIAIRNLSL